MLTSYWVRVRSAVETSVLPNQCYYCLIRLGISKSDALETENIVPMTTAVKDEHIWAKVAGLMPRNTSFCIGRVQ